MLIKGIIISFVLLTLAFLFLQEKIVERHFELPVYLKKDTIADAHHTLIRVRNYSNIPLSSSDSIALVSDYSALWAHLNYLYGTGDVEAGKEYYTEDWFRIICSENPHARAELVSRTDICHQLCIFNLSTDRLVCTAIDSNLHMQFRYRTSPDHDSIVTRITQLAIVLLYQGDHWRIDGLLFTEGNNEMMHWRLTFSGDPALLFYTAVIPGNLHCIDLSNKPHQYETGIYLPLPAQSGYIE